MKATYRIEGLKETQDALQELPKRLQRAALKRVLKLAAEPIRAAAAAFAPRDTGELADNITIATGFDNPVGKAEYHAIKKAGGSNKEAAAAMRSARRSSGGEVGKDTFAYLWVGPSAAKNARDAIKRWVQEFGSKFQRPHPYMRPAFDQEGEHALAIIGQEIGAEVQRTADRLQAKLARIAKGK
jgi:HK97 gp10 family phage protein